MCQLCGTLEVRHASARAAGCSRVRAESPLWSVPKRWTTLLPVALSKARLQPGLRHVGLLPRDDLYDLEQQVPDDAQRHEL